MVSRTIEHKGTVLHVSGDRATVSIDRREACAGCAARSSCVASADGKKMLLEVKSDVELEAGDEVTVVMPVSKGFQAVLLAFAAPLLLVIAVVTVCYFAFHLSETLCALAGLSALAAWYPALYLFRKQINRLIYPKIALLAETRQGRLRYPERTSS